jgi:UPF0716 protein FxsA
MAIMFGYLILLFTILPALELAVLIHVGSYIGAGNTIIIIILTGIAGAYLARLQGFLVIHNIQSRLAQGVMPTEEMLDGLMIFCGGILLLTPGFITDMFGFLLLIPLIRMIIKAAVQKKFQSAIYREGNLHYPSGREQSSRTDFEDADFLE